MKKIEYSLHTGQWDIWRDESRYRILVAGRRFGKTVLALYALFNAAISKTNSQVWYIAPTYKQAKMIAWKMLKGIIPEQMIEGKPNESELMVNLRNGSEICLKGADNENSLRGVGLDFVVMDEVAEMKRNVWEEIVRPMLTDTKGKAIFIGTPKGKNQLWELWLKGQNEENWGTYRSWKYKSIDNPYLDPVEIEEAKEQMSERYFRQEYEASFEDFVGMIWPEFSEKHLFKTMKDDEYEFIGAIDPAVSGTTGALMAKIDGNDDIWIYDEFYEPNVRVSEVAKHLKHYKKVKWFIDPASLAGSRANTKSQTYSLYHEYQEHGIHAQLANNDVPGGINRVAEYFMKGKLHIHKRCKNLIWELERYHWAEDRETVLGLIEPKPYKKNDHLCFVGNTKVLMADGSEKNIKGVKAGDYVRTSNGTQKVLDSRKTGISEVVKTKFTNGTELISTQNHPIYTHNGKKRVDALRYCDIIQTCKNKSYIKGKSTTGMADIIRQLVEALMAGSVYMLRYGKIIMGKFLQTAVSTIEMGIPAITTSQILNCGSQANIVHTTAKKDYQIKSFTREIKNIWNEYDHSQRNGMVQKRAKNGIHNTVKMLGKIENLLKNNVLTVNQNLCQRMEQENTVQTTANPHAEEAKRKITLRNIVKYVTNSLKHTNINKPKPVHALAQQKCRILQEVYNLTVENTHNYYANGILVSNCDCIRYLVQTRYHAPEKPKKKELFSYRDRTHDLAMKQIFELQKKREEIGEEIGIY